MIAEFVSSWPLFQYTYLSGWLIALLLSSLGVLVAARDQIFLGAAISQASLVGIAGAMVLAGTPWLAACVWCQSDGFLSVAGGLCAVLAALVTTGSRRLRGQSYEAMTGWVFLFSSSLAILLVAHSPHPLEEVHRLLSSTIIGATAADVVAFAALTAIVLLALRIWRAPLLLLVMDPEMARAVGVRVGLLDRLLSVGLGLSVGLSLRVSGMLFAFGCLVLPALIAREVCREVRQMFIVAPVVAVTATAAAFILANHHDYPPGQVAVTVLGALLALIWIGRHMRAR